ncbi:unnamed protein product [Adineta steineri]|uniref:Uncharacterized protein n=1 Tax=Adineta steineri TaxID=433720 RepID=A0A818MPJ1_9BILA|nr:unnamed protein product [Adineta steineri]
MTTIETATTESTICTKLESSSIFLLVCILYGLIMTFSQLFIGWKYVSQCPINPNIPKYLFVNGIIGIFSPIFVQYRTYLLAKTSKSSKVTNNRKTGVSLAAAMNNPLLFIINIAHYCRIIFLFIWFTYGCKWIFGVWNEVKYDPRNHPQFCLSLVYRLAYIPILMSIVFLFLCSCCCCCCFICIASVKMFRIPTESV